MIIPSNDLQHQAGERPDAIAFYAGDQVYSYRRMSLEVERFARMFRARGVRPGDRIALHMTNVPELIIAYFACFSIGAIAVPLNLRLKAAELRSILQRLQPVLYLGQARSYLEVIAIEPGILAYDARFVIDRTVENAGARPWAEVTGDIEASATHRVTDVDAPAALLWTSGTTGEPKFVVHTARTLAATAAAYEQYGIGPHEIVVITLPMTHAGGFAAQLAAIHFGSTMVLIDHFDADIVLDAIERHKCTWLAAFPFMYVALLQRQRDVARDTSTLRYCATSSDVCPPQLQREFAGTFGLPLRSFWGATEVVDALSFGLEIGPVSRIVPGTEIAIIDDAGKPVRRGEIGELLIRAASVFVGYWAGPDRISDAPPHGWYHAPQRFKVVYAFPRNGLEKIDREFLSAFGLLMFNASLDPEDI